MPYNFNGGMDIAQSPSMLLIGDVSSDNPVSKRILEKLGFKFSEYVQFSDQHILRPQVKWERWRRAFPRRQ